MTSSPPSYDVAVVGAGPAGASCALRLAEAGRRVALLDQKVPPRYKTCGGGLVWRARELFGIELNGCVETECHTAEMHLLDAGLEFRVEHTKPLVTMTMRADLDHRLVEAARAAGVELLAPRRVRGLTQSSSDVQLETDGEPLVARYCVAADGAGSRTARAAGWPENENVIPALESEIRVAPIDHARFAGSARFDFGLLPSGYAWVFPKRDHLSVGCLSRLRGWGALREDLETYLKHLGLAEHGRREDHGFVIPVAPRSAELARGRVALIGDAAGLADPVTGEGISWAILSGHLAARALTAHPDDPAAMCNIYSELLDRDMLPELKIARRLAGLLYEYPRLRRLAFRRVGQSLCDVVGGVFLGEQSYRDLVRNPRNYFKLARRFVGLS
jgi:geranylgeranyl reductase family protein